MSDTEAPSPDAVAALQPSGDTPAVTNAKSSTKGGDPLLQTIKSAVNATNSALASLEESTNDVSLSFASRMRSLGQQTSVIMARAMSAYDTRIQYGPQIVAGTAVVLGGVVALRRGKIPGTLAASIGGAAAYGNIYGYEDYSATSWRNSVPKIDS